MRLFIVSISIVALAVFGLGEARAETPQSAAASGVTSGSPNGAQRGGSAPHRRHKKKGHRHGKQQAQGASAAAAGKPVEGAKSVPSHTKRGPKVRKVAAGGADI